MFSLQNQFKHIASFSERFPEQDKKEATTIIKVYVRQKYRTVFVVVDIIFLASERSPLTHISCYMPKKCFVQEWHSEQGSQGQSIRK